MTVIEEGCGRPSAAEKWQKLFFRLMSDIEGKFPRPALTRIEEAFVSNLDIAATEYEMGTFNPSCSAQLGNTKLLEHADRILGKI